MTISAIETEKMDNTNKKIVERTCKATDEAIVTLKEISNSLSPHLLKNYGLMRALETLARQLLGNSGIRFELTGNIHSKHFQYDLEISLFRIFSELLNNSIKHGNPSKITINIEDKSEYLSVHYSDDGCGFDQLKTKKEPIIKGMGLENINSRIKSMNGHYYMDSKPDKGVSVYFQIPVK